MFVSHNQQHIIISAVHDMIWWTMSMCTQKRMSSHTRSQTKSKWNEKLKKKALRMWKTKAARNPWSPTTSNYLESIVWRMIWLDGGTKWRSKSCAPAWVQGTLLEEGLGLKPNPEVENFEYCRCWSGCFGSNTKWQIYHKSNQPTNYTPFSRKIFSIAFHVRNYTKFFRQSFVVNCLFKF